MDAMAVVRGGTTTATATGHARPAMACVCVGQSNEGIVISDRFVVKSDRFV
jgi:hypothetical protein